MSGQANALTGSGTGNHVGEIFPDVGKWERETLHADPFSKNAAKVRQAPGLWFAAVAAAYSLQTRRKMPQSNAAARLDCYRVAEGGCAAGGGAPKPVASTREAYGKTRPGKP